MNEKAEKWLEKYYPVPAKDVPDDAMADVEHSLRKWRGLRKNVLDKYDLHVTFLWSVADEGKTILDIDANTCALCLDFEINGDCSRCPIVKFQGTSCDARGENVGERSPYGAWCVDNDPEPMIKLLERTRRWLKKNNS